MEENSKFFTEDCVKAMVSANAFAKKKKYEFVTVDNFMMFIAQTKKGKEIFEAMNMDVEHFISSITQYLDENIPKIVSGDEPQWTIQLRELREKSIVLQKASDSRGKSKVDEGFILVSLFEVDYDDCFTRSYFDHFEITRFDVMSFIAHNKKKEKNGEEEEVKETTKNYLNKYAILLNKKAQDGKIDSTIGRSKEIERTIEILCQRRKNNPILVGEPGVGKTAIAEGLAKRITEGNVPDLVKNFNIYSLDMPSVLAGTKYRGDFEERLKSIIKEATNDENVILFIDEIHTLIGTGAGTGTMDASNILKPALSSGEIKVIGATTYDEYRKHFEKEGSLARRFQKVDVEEPSSEDTFKILMGIKEQYEKFHGVVYTEEALKSAVDLTVKFVTDRHLPDKAIDVIDIAGSQVKLSAKNNEIDENMVKMVVAKMARIPIDSVKETEKDKLKNLETNLKNEIFGQDAAIEKTVNSVLYSRSNIMHREKPIASFLFAGSSGVGKTELAKQLANKLGISFVRFDMSEYMEKFSVSKLIGSPPGYVGYEQGGQLIEAIKKNPYCVLLLDEIEKAHQDIFNILLQVMDYASLTDNDGKKANFKNVILIMTTNLGASEINKSKIGFSQYNTESIDRENQIKKHFSPEFYNRLDGVIQFTQLNVENIEKIVRKQIKKLQESLLNKKIVSFFTQEAIEFIVKNGFDEKMGARPLERYIEKNIAQVLAKEVLFGKLEMGGEIKIDVINDVLDIQYLCNYGNNIKVIKDVVCNVDMEKPKRKYKKGV